MVIFVLKKAWDEIVISVNWFYPVDFFLLTPVIHHIWTPVGSLRIHLVLITLYRHSTCIYIMLCLQREVINFCLVWT